MKKLNLVIVGNGMVGHHLVERLVRGQCHGAIQYYRDREERVVAYDRVHLSSVFLGPNQPRILLLSSEDWYQQQGIRSTF